MSDEKNESADDQSRTQDDFVDSSTARQVELDRLLAEMLQAIEDRRAAVFQQLVELLQEDDEKEEG